MTPYRLHYVSDIEGWAYWWVGLALQEYAPQHVTVTIGCQRADIPRAARDAAGADVVFDMVYQGVPAFSEELQRISPQSILVGGFNVGFPQRGAELLPKLAACSTHVVCNNRATWIEAVQRGILMPDRSSFISIGVDCRKFNVRTPIAARTPRLLSCCSAGHAKWKGVGILQDMESQFREAGFESDIVVVDSHGPERMNQEQLADWYQTGFAYVCNSQPGYEGTPMPALEAAASGCVLIATETGNMPELIRDRWNGVVLSDREPATILEAVRYAHENRERLTANMLESIKPWCWDQRAACYFRLFDRLVNRKGAP